MLLKDASSQRATSPLSREWVFIHEWFAGWRWERHRNGVLVAESWQSFETEEECLANANHNGRMARKPALALAPRRSPQPDEASRLAA